jgi:hypothetical protein
MIRKTTYLKAEYKDFFNIADYLSPDIEDIPYGTLKITSETIKKEIPNQSIATSNSLNSKYL